MNTADNLIMTDSYKVSHNIEVTPPTTGVVKHLVDCKIMDYPFHVHFNKHKQIAKRLFDKFFEVAHEDIQAASSLNLVFRGTSGTFMSALFVEIFEQKYQKEINLALVRKPNEDSHSKTYSDTDRNGLFIWVDDFISSGKTLENCFEYFKQISNKEKFDWAITSWVYSEGWLTVDATVSNIICGEHR
jgi:hypothetical protein